MKNKGNIKTYVILAAAVVFILYLASISRTNWSNRRATETAVAVVTKKPTIENTNVPLWYGTIYCESCLSGVPVLMWSEPFSVGGKESDVVNETVDGDTVRILGTKKTGGQTWYHIKLVPEGGTGWVMEHLIIPD